jgi:hypothetical protein
MLTAFFEDWLASNKETAANGASNQVQWVKEAA